MVNAFGVSFLLLCKIFSIHILNGRNKHDDTGEFTCETHNGRSVVDYMIASTDFFETVETFQVGSFDDSDHFPISCKLLCPEVQNVERQMQITKRYRIRWNKTDKTVKQQFNNNHIIKDKDNDL